jgi:hypothetical protein
VDAAERNRKPLVAKTAFGQFPQELHGAIEFIEALARGHNRKMGPKVRPIFGAVQARRRIDDQHFAARRHKTYLRGRQSHNRNDGRNSMVSASLAPLPSRARALVEIYDLGIEAVGRFDRERPRKRGDPNAAPRTHEDNRFSHD